MKVLVVTHYWHPHRGGVERVALEQARRLAQRGHQVSVVTSRLRGDPPAIHEDGCAIYRVRAINLLERRGIPYPLFSPGLLPLLRRLVASHDVVLAHSHVFLGTVASAALVRLTGKPLVLLQHHPYVRYRPPWSLAEGLLDATLGRFALRSATTLLAISQHTRAYVQRLAGPRPVHLLYNGVDTRRFTPAASERERQEARARLGLPLDRLVLFTVRRLVFRNGLDTLLDACRLLRDERDVLAVIGGTGPERAAMERYIEAHGLRNVRLAGFIPDGLLPDYYRAADVFVLPSLTGEGFGLVLLEAFASGIPAIATRSGGPEEVVEPGRTGLLVPPGGPDSLARAVQELLAQPQRLRPMGQAARTRAEDMDWERNVDRLESFLLGAAGVSAQVPAVEGASLPGRAASP